MRRVAGNKKQPEPIKWVGMRHEADCWIAACAMAAGASYKEAEEAFGEGADYSAETLASHDDQKRRIFDLFKMLMQSQVFICRGY